MVWEPRVFQMPRLDPLDWYQSQVTCFFRSFMGENLDMHLGEIFLVDIWYYFRVGLPDLSMKVHDFSWWRCVGTEIQSNQWHDILQGKRVNIDQESVHLRSIVFWFLGRCRSLCHLLSILPLQLSVPGKFARSEHRNKAMDSSWLKWGWSGEWSANRLCCRFMQVFVGSAMF